MSLIKGTDFMVMTEKFYSTIWIVYNHILNKEVLPLAAGCQNLR